MSVSTSAPWFDAAALPRAFGDAPLSGLLRVQPVDFVVEEQLGFEPDGDGEHLLLQLRKTTLNTRDVVRRLAALAGVHVRDIGFCGLKDRNAQTTQWFSVPTRHCEDRDWYALSGEGVEVLRAVRHRRKLRRGSHRGNAFTLRIRELRGDLRAADERLATISRQGAPNYFAEQRFGRGAANLRAAEAWLRGGARIRDRHRRGLVLSAARSWLFNLVLAERVRQGTWDRLLDGDVANLDGSRSVFAVAAVDDGLRARLRGHDIHPTGPLYGSGVTLSAELPRALEDGVLAAQAPWCSGLERAGLKMERRALRLVPRELAWQQEAGGKELLLRFDLPAGQYATAVLRELVDKPARA
jgi:tRNA pseudouridine13 synthase